MCRYVFTLVQLNRYSSWRCLEWLYKKSVRCIQDVWSASGQQVRLQWVRGLAFCHRTTGWSAFTVLQSLRVNATVWTYMCGWGGGTGRGQGFSDKHLTRPQCIRRKFHSLKKHFKKSRLSPPQWFISLEAWAWTEWSHRSAIMNSYSKRWADETWQLEEEGMSVIWSVDNMRKLPGTI